jgi:hypothetical protein
MAIHICCVPSVTISPCYNLHPLSWQFPVHHLGSEVGSGQGLALGVAYGLKHFGIHSHAMPYIRRFVCVGRVLSQIISSVIFGVKSGTRTGFLQVLRFPLPILIPSNAQYSSIIRGRYNRATIGRRTKRTQSHTGP